MIRSLFIVPVAILTVSRSGILAAVKVIRSLFIVPDVILDALRLVKFAPLPLNKLAVIVPVAVISVVLIPFRAYITPLNDVLIAREYA